RLAPGRVGLASARSRWPHTRQQRPEAGLATEPGQLPVPSQELQPERLVVERLLEYLQRGLRLAEGQTQPGQAHRGHEVPAAGEGAGEESLGFGLRPGPGLEPGHLHDRSERRQRLSQGEALAYSVDGTTWTNV